VYSKCFSVLKKKIGFNGVIKYSISGRLNNLKPVLPNFKVLYPSEPAPHLFENDKFVKINKSQVKKYFKENKKSKIVVTLSPWVGIFV
jgi:hypothetical protein